MNKKIKSPGFYQPMDIPPPEDEPLDSYYSNPEFLSAADNLINVIKDYRVRVKNLPYDGKDVLVIANNILKGRI